MKPVLTFLFCLTWIQLFACCNKISEVTIPSANHVTKDSMKINLVVGSKTFAVTLINNPTAIAFKSGLPITITMKDLNENEKFFDLPDNLATNASNPRTIQTGDLMIYGSNTLVLFYKTFPTSYSYTALGRVDNVAGLTAALGSGAVSVTFSSR